MVLDMFLRQNNHQLDDVLKRINYTESQITAWNVMQYPDELLYVLAQVTKKEISLILYELLHLENPMMIRKVSSDYGLLTAIENEAIYIYLPQTYRKEQTKLVTDVLIEMKIFELELGPIAKYNFVGKKIYEVFLASAGKGEEFLKIESQLANYFVLVHDDDGSLLCHENFKPIE